MKELDSLPAEYFDEVINFVAWLKYKKQEQIPETMLLSQSSLAKDWDTRGRGIGTFVKGDVIVIQFPFTDLSGSKRRPAFVVVDLPGDDIIVCQIRERKSESSCKRDVAAYRRSE